MYVFYAIYSINSIYGFKKRWLVSHRERNKIKVRERKINWEIQNMSELFARQHQLNHITSAKELPNRNKIWQKNETSK